MATPSTSAPPSIPIPRLLVLIPSPPYQFPHSIEENKLSFPIPSSPPPPIRLTWWAQLQLEKRGCTRWTRWLYIGKGILTTTLFSSHYSVIWISWILADVWALDPRNRSRRFGNLTWLEKVTPSTFELEISYLHFQWLTQWMGWVEILWESLWFCQPRSY